MATLTGEFEVSGTSLLYAGAMGIAPVDIDGESRILVAWHKAPVPGGGFEAYEPFTRELPVTSNPSLLTATTRENIPVHVIKQSA